jgi:hypothetical protein
MRYLEQKDLKTDVLYMCETYTGNLGLMAYRNGGYEDIFSSDDEHLPLDGHIRYVWDLENAPEEIIGKLTEEQKGYRNFILGWRKKYADFNG